MKNLEQKIQVLKENHSVVEGSISLKEYVELEAASDPNFYSWLFGVDFEQDFDTSLTDEQREEYKRFLDKL